GNARGNHGRVAGETDRSSTAVGSSRPGRERSGRRTLKEERSAATRVRGDVDRIAWAGLSRPIVTSAPAGPCCLPPSHRQVSRGGAKTLRTAGNPPVSSVSLQRD